MKGVLELNRYTLTKEIKEKYLPIVDRFIDKIEGSENLTDEEYTIDFSDTELNPYRLIEIMKELGYKEGDLNENGWQWNFSVEFTKENSKPITVWGCGMTFELNLSVSDFM